MKTIYSQKLVCILVAGFILLLGGCANPTASPATFMPLANSLTHTVTATATLPSSLRPTPPDSSSATPEMMPTKTLTATRIPTWTPVSTLPPKDADTALKDLYSNNGHCQIPCWWGIFPGETTWSQANELLAPMALEPFYTSRGKNEITLYDITFRIPEGVKFPTDSGLEGDFYNHYFNPILFIQNDMVLAIDLSIGWINQDFDYSLPTLLNMLGQPNEIWLRLITDVVPEYGPRYGIVLFYPTKGLLLNSGGNATWQDNKLQICPQEFWIDTTLPGIILWNPKLDISFRDINDNLLGDIRNTYFDEYILLDDLTKDFDVTDFYNTYLDPDSTTCFEVPPK